jgi:hypothetical protein
VPNALRAPAILVKHGDRSQWCSSDRDVEEWLRAHPALSAVGPRLSYAHLETTPAGAWFLQLRPLSGGRGHLALRPGEGGVSELLGLVEHLRIHVPQAHAAERPFLVETAFGAIAARTLGTQRTTTMPPPPPHSPASGVHATPQDDVEHPRLVTAALHLFACGRYRESIAMWKSIARDTPDRERRWQALQQIAYCYDALEDYERAVHFFELSLAEGAPLAEITDDLGRSRRKLG